MNILEKGEGEKECGLGHPLDGALGLMGRSRSLSLTQVHPHICVDSKPPWVTLRPPRVCGASISVHVTKNRSRS